MRKRQKIRAALLVPSLISLLFFYFPSIGQAEQAISCDQYQVNGGDQAFLMQLNTPLKWGNTIYNGNIYTSPKGTVTFGQGDYTFWDYPQTPSISIAAYDYHAFANGVMWGANNDLYVRYGSTSTSVCVDWKVMLWGQSTGQPIYIRMIAYVDPVTYEWTPTYQVSSNAPQNARYGARYTQGGPITPLEIQFISEPPAPEPTEIPTQEPSPEPTETPTETPSPEPSTEEPTNTPSPEPTEEPSPTPSEEPSVEPEPTLEPSPEPQPSQPNPNPVQTPIPTLDPEREEIPQQIEQEEEMQEQEEQLIMPSEEPTPIVEEIIIEEPIISEEELLEEGEVLLENGVIIDENIAIALAVLDNPAELFSALFNDPQQVLTALNNLGADMSPEVREEAQDVVVVAVIVAQIIGSVTMASTITQMNARSEIRRIT